ncbi:endonuclease domain-containing protein [Gemmiger sp.]
MRIPRNGGLLENARALRKNMTREERHLWYDFLRGYSPRFVRQKVVGNYILDFYCDAADLAVELDGGQHYEEESRRHDAQRTEYLEELGIKVLRFSNLDVMQHFEGVCRVIDDAVKKPPLEGRCPAGAEGWPGADR